MDDIMESILGHTGFGDPQTNLEVENVTVTVGKVQADHVENQTINTNQGSVKVQSLSLQSSDQPSTCIEQKVCLFMLLKEYRTSSYVTPPKTTTFYLNQDSRNPPLSVLRRYMYI